MKERIITVTRYDGDDGYSPEITVKETRNGVTNTMRKKGGFQTLEDEVRAIASALYEMESFFLAHPAPGVRIDIGEVGWTPEWLRCGELYGLDEPLRMKVDE